ncbi:acyl carrier protein [Bifidobacterium vansinderenii]|uniref:Acyl carrier protein n=1 Tax=Bifidobacterium vansinderenii TaxID=1984871 RepID=A0A229VX38_9BIFI|nr:phosphopantetheine-binding protein [Bifidobacterium vansinderenii]OXN00173.1 acyl carrier protein [Bifidobacterium vansinderenii]
MFEKVRTMLLEYVDVDPRTITPETEFLKDLKVTSYDILTMVGELEDEFGISIGDDELKDMITVGDLAKYLSDNV